MDTTTRIDNNTSILSCLAAVKNLTVVKKHHVRSISVLMSSLLLSAVSMSAHAGSLISSTEYLSYQLPKDIQALCEQRNNCPDIEVKYLKSSQPWINEIVNARIDASVVNSRLAEPAVDQKDISKKDVASAIDDFVRPQFQDMPKETSWAYNLMVTPEYLGHVDQFELFEVNTYLFTGGAHGMSSSEYLIFDPSTKKQVTLDDMFISGKKPLFKALAYDAYKTWVKTVTDDVSSYEKNWPFTLSDNVTLTDTGISIRYQNYSIGPYAYGMPVLRIPYSKLDKIIKPHFIPK